MLEQTKAKIDNLQFTHYFDVTLKSISSLHLPLSIVLEGSLVIFPKQMSPCPEKDTKDVSIVQFKKFPFALYSLSSSPMTADPVMNL